MARILVVDDLPDNLALAKRHLSGGEHEVSLAPDAETAVQMVETGQVFDLFILDVVLPGMSGYEFCEWLRQREDTADLPVLFVTGERSDVPDRLQGFRSGANDYLLKPVDRRELLARVDVLLRLRNALADVRSSNERLANVVNQRTRALKEAMNELQEHQVLLETMLHQLPAAIVVFDQDRRLVTANEEAGRVFGLEIMGVRLSETALAPVFDHPLEPGKGRLRVYLETREGTRMFEVEGSRLETDASRWLLHLVDVTERERLLEKAKGREVADLIKEIEVLKDELHSRYRMSRVIGTSPAMRRLAETVDKLRHRFGTILIRGESGTGKELVARAIHFDGNFADRPFVAVNCGAIPDSLFESEFFGHKRGSFTGADRDKPGLISQAEGGTLFLDEIGELSMEAQTKLLRFLQNGEVRMVGSPEVSRVRCRLIAATHRNLTQMVEEGAFRQDLYFRIEAIQVEIPPLRERPEDIAALAGYFLRVKALENGRQDEIRGISREAMRVLEDYDWPGNVRELESIFERAVLLGSGPTLHVEDLPKKLTMPVAPRRSLPLIPVAMQKGAFAVPPARGRRQLDAETILSALRTCRGNRKRASELLGVSRSTLYRKIEEFDLQDSIGKPSASNRVPRV